MQKKSKKKSILILKYLKASTEKAKEKSTFLLKYLKTSTNNRLQFFPQFAI